MENGGTVLVGLRHDNLVKIDETVSRSVSKGKLFEIHIGDVFDLSRKGRSDGAPSLGRPVRARSGSKASEKDRTA